MAKDDPAAMTPGAAVARHLEWLEFALAAARDEEARRRERLGQAINKNREKRTVRLAEVTAEVRELAALVKGVKDLQSKATAPVTAGRHRVSSAKPQSPRATRPRATTAGRSTTGAAAAASSAAAPSTTPQAAPTPKAAGSAKPRATTRKTATRRAAASAAKPSATRARKPATRRRTRKPPAPPA